MTGGFILILGILAHRVILDNWDVQFSQETQSL